MSELALKNKIEERFGSQSLSAFYDFGSSIDDVEILGEDSEFTGVCLNSQITNDPSLHKAFVLPSYGSSELIAGQRLTGVLDGNRMNLNSGNLEIPLDGLNSNKISFLIDFEFEGNVNNGILFGCFNKGDESINSIVSEVSSGFNIGVTDRGNLFCQTLNADGDSIAVLSNLELSKRNLIGVSISNRSLQLGYFDYFNDLVSSITVPVNKEYISNSDRFFIGGSEKYFDSTSNSTPTFSGYVNSLALFSGYVDLNFLKEAGESTLSTYEFTAETSEVFTRITGYEQSIIYRTGITGYDYESTGTLSIATGREYVTGSFTPLASSSEKKEGERYYKYYELNNGQTKTFYKEELGQLHSNSGYTYYPTGELAYDTLGLNDISESIQAYTELSGIEQDTVTIDLYNKTPLYGTMSDISGLITITGFENYTVVTPASSGISFDQNSEDFKKNYIYYLGGRNEL